MATLSYFSKLPLLSTLLAIAQSMHATDNCVKINAKKKTAAALIDSVETPLSAY